MSGSISFCIRAYISRLENEELFTSSELRIFGNRTAIDQCIYRLVRKEIIKRVGHGIFLKPDRRGKFREVPDDEVIKKIAEVNGTRIVVHSTKEGKSYLSNGRNGSVMVNGRRIKIHKVCNRKLNLGESKAGSLLRELWFEGKIQSGTIWDDAEKIRRFKRLDASDREELRGSAPLLPDWLNKAINRKDFGRYLNKEDRLKRLSAIEAYRERQDYRKI